jgi:amino acid transporter
MSPGLLTYINFVSVKLFVRVQNVFTVSKLLACLIIVISGIYMLCAGRYSVRSQVLALTVFYCGELATLTMEHIPNYGKNLECRTTK